VIACPSYTPGDPLAAAPLVLHSLSCVCGDCRRREALAWERHLIEIRVMSAAHSR
jgi:hypothetical protein